MPQAVICPVCTAPLRAPVNSRGRTGDVSFYNCPRCGRFGLTGSAEAVITTKVTEAGAGTRERTKASIAHTLRKMQASQEWPLLDSDVANQIGETLRLPGVQEQADNLIRWLGESAAPGDNLTISFLEHGAILGAQSSSGFVFLARGMVDAGQLQGSFPGGDSATVRLSFEGWQRCEELRRGAPSGNRAFVAMQYGDERMDRIVREHFCPAVERTGFNLKRLDDDPRAGLIDDRLRIEIQGARFVLADLTHDNRGAYWEAGYAEGLGKPVIYTCEKKVFDAKKSHFDTNHHLYVVWEEEYLGDAMDRLKVTIRATIPEAKREDI